MTDRPNRTPNRGRTKQNLDDVRARFGATAGLVAQHAEQQVEMVREQLRSFVAPKGDERVLDAGTGAGTLALALAPLVREVVGVDVVPELLERARKGAPANVTFVEGDATSLPFESGSFDLACSRRTLHHIARPERAVAELARVVAPGGRVYVDDQIAPVDPLAALELDRFERARDPSHARTLPDIDLRHLFEANGLVLQRTQFQTHRRELDYYLDLAGCEGEQRERARQLSPGGPNVYVAESGWYLLVKPG
jgi:ubiquinone/menaquinone biosynthesis C-methylase UbiE